MQPFIRKEERCFTFDDWTTENCAEVVMTKIGLLQTVAVGKPVVGSESAATKIFKKTAAKLIAARARLQDHLSARGAAIFGRKRARQDLELLQGINRKQAVRCAK